MNFTKLPLDADVTYCADFLTANESRRLYEAIIASGDVSNLTMIAAGKRYTLDFGRFMYADASLVDSQALVHEMGKPRPWMNEVREVKEKVESAAGREYNVCVCIYYGNGESCVDFHADLPAMLR